MNLEKMMKESEYLSNNIKDHIIEEWRVAEEIKESGSISRESFISAMKQSIPRLNGEHHITDEKVFLRVYYDNTPFWCRKENKE